MAYNNVKSHKLTNAGYTPYPITVAQAKDFCRVDENNDTVEDELFSLWIRMAFTKVEHYTRLSLQPKTCVAILCNPQGDIELPFGPVSGTPTFVDAQGVAMEVYLQGTDLGYPYAPYAFEYTKATYTVGFADGEIPDELVEAMYVLINFFYENRGDVNPDGASYGAGIGYCPQAIALCQKWRRTA